MGLFSAIINVADAIKDTVMIPVDVVVDMATVGDNKGSNVARRAESIKRKLRYAYDETVD